MKQNEKGVAAVSHGIMRMREILWKEGGNVIKRIIVLTFFCLSIFTVAFAKSTVVDVSSLGNIISIEITVKPDYSPTIEQLVAEDEVIQRLTGNKLYVSKVEEFYDKIKTNYDIEEVKESGQFLWKCTPKNPKTIQVAKVRNIEYVDADGNAIHATEHYIDEIPNPNYIEDKKKLESKVIWCTIEKKEEIDSDQESSKVRSIW